MAPRRKNRYEDAPVVSDSWLFKWGTRFLLGIFVILIFLTLVRCTVKSPKSPEWTTQLTIPLINRTMSMQELVDRIGQSEVGISGNNVVFTINQEIDTVTLDSTQLSTGDLSYSLSQQLGPIDIAPPSLAPVSIDLSDMGPLAAVIPGIVPAVSFQITGSLPTISNFTSVTLTAGTAYVVMTNNLGLDLDTVIITLIDRSDMSIISSRPVIGGIASGVTDSIPIALTGLTISNLLDYTIDAHTNGGVVLSASGLNVVTSVNFPSQLTASSAVAEVPATSRSFSQQITLGETEPIYRATLTGGQLSLNINNSSQLTASLTLTFPDLQQAGSPLVINQSVGANSNVNNTVSIAGYELLPSDSSVPQLLDIDVQISIPGTAPSQVAVNQTDQFDVTATLQGLQFGSVTGVFSATGLTIPPSVLSIDVPIGFDSVQLVNAIFTLDIVNAVDLPGLLNIDITGSNGKSLNYAGTIQPGSPSLPVVTTFLDSAVANFLTPLPTSVTISGSASFGDGMTEGTFTSNDFIVARVNIVAPLELILGTTTVQMDTERSAIDQSSIDIITDHVEELRFVYNIINHLPFGAQASIYLGSDSATLFTNPQLLINGLFINAAPTISGIVSDTASTGYQTIVLTAADISVLENDTLFSAVELVLQGSGGQVIRLTASDYITLQGRIEVDYLFDGNF